MNFFLPTMSLYEHMTSNNAYADDQVKIGSYSSARNDKGYRLAFLLPGYKKQDVEVSIEGNRLLIDAKREDQEKDDLVLNIPKEFSKKLKLKNLNIDEDKVEATMSHGILVVELPLLESSKKKVSVK